MRIERFDGKLLVSYRHMYIREIDMDRGNSRPLVVVRREQQLAAEWDSPVALRAPNQSHSEIKPDPEREV